MGEFSRHDRLLGASLLVDSCPMNARLYSCYRPRRCPKIFFNRTPLFMSNHLTSPGSRTCRESGRISRGVRGMSDKKGQKSSKRPELRHISRLFRLVRNPENLKCFVLYLLRPSCSRIPLASLDDFLFRRQYLSSGDIRAWALRAHCQLPAATAHDFSHRHLDTQS